MSLLRLTLVVVCLLAASTMASQEAFAQTVAVQSATVNQPRLQGGWLFDDVMRAGLRAPTADGRAAADTASTVLMWSLAAAPYATAGVETWRLHGTWIDFGALSLVNSEAFALTFASQWVLKTLVGRERPFATAAGLSVECVSNPNAPGCSSDRNASFPSGHTAVAFTAAGLICAQRLYLGERTPSDAVICGSAMAAATGTALLRIVADEHWTTDTLVGAAIGLTSGLFLPWLLHFRPGAPLPVGGSMRTYGPWPDRQSRRTTPRITAEAGPWFPGNGGAGLSVTGTF